MGEGRAEGDVIEVRLRKLGARVSVMMLGQGRRGRGYLTAGAKALRC